MDIKQRTRLLRKLRDTLLTRADDVIATAHDESGKVLFEAVALELVPTVLNLSYVASIAPEALANETLRPFLPSARRAHVAYHPVGVCALVSPWNYTLAIAMATIAPALAAGNAVVWKPAPRGVRMAALLHEVLVAAGLDGDLLQVLPCDVDTGRALLQADIDHVTFVGSTAVGREVARVCGERLIPCIVELGGKAPAIVMPDADLTRAARAIAYGRLANLGASCVAVERVLVHASVADALRSRLLEIFATTRLEMTRVHDLSRVHAAVQQARSHGARVSGDGPWLIEGTDHLDLELSANETFAPALTFERFHSVDDAIARANAHALQLSAYVFCRDRVQARAIARRLRAPNVVVNDVMTQYALMEVPFGGRGSSGIGRVHGIAGLRALCHAQVLVEGHLPINKEPWWLPYDDAIAKLALRTLPVAVRLWDRISAVRR